MAIDEGLKLNIFSISQSFKNIYMSILNAKRTGNPTPTHLINAVVVMYIGLSRPT